MALGLFVYYRSSPEHSRAVQSHAQALQTALLRRWPLLRGEFLQKQNSPSSPGSPVTWMEIYRWPDEAATLHAPSATPDAPETRLSQQAPLPTALELAQAREALAAQGLHAGLQGSCHLEWFDTPAPA